MQKQKKSDALETLPNIGKTSAAALRKIGIETASEFLRRDPYDVFDELRAKVDTTFCSSMLAGIVGAKRGVKWHAVSKEAAAEYEKRHPGHKWGCG